MLNSINMSPAHPKNCRLHKTVARHEGYFKYWLVVHKNNTQSTVHCNLSTVKTCLNISFCQLCIFTLIYYFWELHLTSTCKIRGCNETVHASVISHFSSTYNPLSASVTSERHHHNYIYRERVMNTHSITQEEDNISYS